MANPNDKVAQQTENLKNLIKNFSKKLTNYKGSMNLVNSKRISPHYFAAIVNFLGDFTDTPEMKYNELNQTVKNIEQALSNDINNRSSEKLSKADRAFLDEMRTVRNAIRDINNPLQSQLNAQKTIEEFFDDYHKGKAERASNAILDEIGINGKKPSYEQCQKLSILGGSPSEVMPYMIWLAQQNAMAHLIESGIDGKAEESIYRTNYERLLQELQLAPTDVQAQYAVYFGKYEMGLRKLAKEHYDEYMKEPAQGESPEYHAAKKLTSDPVYWSCSNARHFAGCFNNTRLGDVYSAMVGWEKLGPSPFLEPSHAFIGKFMSTGLFEIVENELKNKPGYPEKENEQGGYVKNHIEMLTQPEIKAAKERLMDGGFTVDSPKGMIAYGYSHLLADNGKGGTLFNSMKHAFNDFAIKNHDDIDELSRKDYYKKLGRAESAVNRYLEGFKGKTPKGADLERFTFATQMKDALSGHRANIVTKYPEPKPVPEGELKNTREVIKSVNDILKEAEKVDPGYIKSSKEFKAIKNTLKEFDKYAKSVSEDGKLSLDEMEILKEYCQTLELQTEAYIELKEDPIRSPKKEYLNKDSNTAKRYDFAKKLQNTVRLMNKSVSVQEEKTMSELAVLKRENQNIDAPIDAHDYFKHIDPLLKEQIDDAHNINECRFDYGTEKRNKTVEQLCKQYDIKPDSKALDYAFMINDLRGWGLEYTKADISIAMCKAGMGTIDDIQRSSVCDINLPIKYPNKFGLTKLITAEILEDRLMKDPASLENMDRKKYNELQGTIEKFVEEKYSNPENPSAGKQTTADRLLKDFCMKDGARQKVKEFDEFVAEKKLNDPSKEKLQKAPQINM